MSYDGRLDHNDRGRTYADKLESVLHIESGRILIMFSAYYCAACKELQDCIEARNPGLIPGIFVVSKFEQGEPLTRSLHRSIGVLRYPTVFFVNEKKIVGRIDGIVRRDVSVDVDPYLMFIDSGELDELVDVV